MDNVFYVSPNGNDNNSGGLGSPFLTPQRAVDAVIELNSNVNSGNITVYFEAGEYNIKSIKLNELSGGKGGVVTYKALDGEVIFNAGAEIKNNLFKPVTDETVLKRLSKDARGKVMVASLSDAGITKEQIGKLYAWGTYSPARSYNDGTYGNNCEVFWDGRRMTLARWPNKADGHINFDGVIDEGDPEKLIPGTLKLGAEALERTRSWQNINEAGIFAYYKFDWADMASGIKSFDPQNGHITPLHHSIMGYNDNGAYYFYNILEELDTEGEYYIDRENMLLYVYPPEGTEASDALITLSEEKLVSGNVSNIRFEGITFEGTKNNIIELVGDNIALFNCKVINGGADGIRLTGYNNIVHSCEVAYLGKEGVLIEGGDRRTLTPGNCVLENSYIHHFAEVYRTYKTGVALRGCGNRAIYNEIAYAPHMAFGFTGNDHEYAFNYIHDVVYESNDAGAFYGGGDYTGLGTVIRYNMLRNIGGVEGKYPNAIYYDDGMSFGIVEGNIIENCYGNAVLLGGGREHIVKNNLIIDTHRSIWYDARMAADGWASIYRKTKPEEGIWKGLTYVPYKNDIWLEKYPQVSRIVHDYERYEDPYFMGNPALSEIQNNISIGERAGEEYWIVEDDVKKYSGEGIRDNYSFADCGDILIDGTYSVNKDIAEKLSVNWQDIPWENIGRYDHKIKFGGQK